MELRFPDTDAYGDPISVVYVVPDSADRGMTEDEAKEASRGVSWVERD